MNSRPVDRTKIYAGVFLVCLAAMIMLAEKDRAYPLLRVIWIVLAAAGVFLYLWGRFFSRGSD